MSPDSSDAGRVATLVGVLFGLAGMGSAAVAVTLPALARDLDHGSAVVGGLGEVLGTPQSLLVLALLPVAGVLGLSRDIARART